jgi:hypothetical protein
MSLSPAALNPIAAWNACDLRLNGPVIARICVQPNDDRMIRLAGVTDAVSGQQGEHAPSLGPHPALLGQWTAAVLAVDRGEGGIHDLVT